VSAEERCPVSKALLGRLSSCSAPGLPALLEEVPPERRAALALYCYRRARLQRLGIDIGGTCAEHDLWWAGGKVGMELSCKAKQVKRGES
jgi:hypothetical protein